MAAPDLSRRSALLNNLLSANRQLSQSSLSMSVSWPSDVAQFLEALELFADSLDSKAASRIYRHRFSINYQSLFPSTGRHYRADILLAGFECCPTMFVNGEKFDFDVSVRQLAVQLLAALRQLRQALFRCDMPTDLDAQEQDLSMSLKLEVFDLSWVDFESAYIQQLMAVEDKARGVLATACERERVLRLYEKTAVRQLLENGLGAPRRYLCEDGTFVKLLCELLESLGRLNSVANVEGKGRDSFQAEVILQAMREMEASQQQADKASRAAAEDLCREVLDAFRSIRWYLRTVASCLELVDPQLCNNAGLVSRLLDWEDVHDIGALFLQQRGALQSFCRWVSTVQEVKHLSSEMRCICDTYDAELFLVLPRLLWLCHLTTERTEGLLPLLLPRRAAQANAELRAALAELHDPGLHELLQLCVSGPGSVRPGSERDAFLRALERWSMELQRTEPREWNRCSQVLLRCIAGDLRRSRSYQFAL